MGGSRQDAGPQSVERPMEIIARRDTQAYASFLDPAPSLSGAVMAGYSASEDARKRAYVPATSIVMALCLNSRARRDESAFTRVFRRAMPGDDGSCDV
jgi:hypothetical protein